MKVFISWSGRISRQVADALNEWLPCVLQEVKPFLSSESIHKGLPWFEVIGEQLGETSFSILCLTPSNLEAPWILFEAGALSVSKEGADRARVIPLLLGLSPSGLKPPLSNFNAATCAKDEVLRLLGSLNAGLKDKTLEGAKLEKIFEKWWPDFEVKIKQAEDALEAEKAGSQTGVAVPRTVEDMLGEVLELTRNTAQRLDKDAQHQIALNEISRMLDEMAAPLKVRALRRLPLAEAIVLGQPSRASSPEALTRILKAAGELPENPKKTDDGSSSST